MGYVRDDGKTMVAQPHLDLGPQEDVDAGPPAPDGPGAEPERLLNEMTPEERAAFHADYIRGAPPAGPAPADG